MQNFDKPQSKKLQMLETTC